MSEQNSQRPSDERTEEAAPKAPVSVQTKVAASAKTPVVNDLPQRALVIGALALCAVWGVWVSKNVYDLHHSANHIVKVRLSDIVSEYVQSAARSSVPQDQLAQQSTAFLKAVNQAVEHHRGQGEVVMLANAIVAGDVPDITDDIRMEVYKQVASPQPSAGAGDVQAQMKQFMSASASAAPTSGATNGK